MLSNRQGVFLFPSLQAGEYVVRVDAPGFAPAEKSLTLLVGKPSSSICNRAPQM